MDSRLRGERPTGRKANRGFDDQTHFAQPVVYHSLMTEPRQSLMVDIGASLMVAIDRAVRAHSDCGYLQLRDILEMRQVALEAGAQLAILTHDPMRMRQPAQALPDNESVQKVRPGPEWWYARAPSGPTDYPDKE